MYISFFFSWSADQILGPPKVYPEYGDLHGAWASEECNLQEFIEVNKKTSSLAEKLHYNERLFFLSGIYM